MNFSNHLNSWVNLHCEYTERKSWTFSFCMKAWTKGLQGELVEKKQKHFGERRDNTGDPSASGIPRTYVQFLWNLVRSYGRFGHLCMRQLFPRVSIPLAAPAWKLWVPGLQPERSWEPQAPAAPPWALGSQGLPAGTRVSGLPYPRPHNLENCVAILQLCLTERI